MSSFLNSLKQNQKFWLVLPVIVIPFLVVFFLLLGGGKGKTEPNSSNQTGLNLQLPDAHFGKKKDQDKMGLYDAAGIDSLKSKSSHWWSTLMSDSNRANRMSFENNRLKELEPDSILLNAQPNPFLATQSSSYSSIAEKKEKVLEEQLDVLNRQLKEPLTPKKEQIRHVLDDRNLAVITAEPKKEEPATVDPEIMQLNKMLDKVMAIQHSESQSDSGKARPLIQTMTRSVQDESGNNTITAVIPIRQTLMTGSTICIKLAEPVLVDGNKIEPGHLIYGTVTLINERLKIQIKSIRHAKTILAVNLEGYDLDGLAGVYIPGSLNRDVSKESLDQGMSNLGLATLDPSIGAQAVSAGIQTAKNLMSRKVKLVRVTVPAGYQLLLTSAH